jgi:hypothetical protein
MTTADRMVELQFENIHEVMSADDNSENRSEITEEWFEAIIRDLSVDDNSENRSEPTDEDLDGLIHDLYPTPGVPREEFTEKFQTRMRDLLKILLQPLDPESSNAEPLRPPEPSQNNNA